MPFGCLNVERGHKMRNTAQWAVRSTITHSKRAPKCYPIAQGYHRHVNTEMIEVDMDISLLCI
eukprot:scaffold156110_cov23-Prasinocladus_malaysianus.AAC.1